MWEVSYIKDNRWVNIKPNDDKILENILTLLKTNSYSSLEEITNFENIDENININIDENINKNINENVDENINENINKNVDE